MDQGSLRFQIHGLCGIGKEILPEATLHPEPLPAPDHIGYFRGHQQQNQTVEEDAYGYCGLLSSRLST